MILFRDGKMTMVLDNWKINLFLFLFYFILFLPSDILQVTWLMVQNQYILAFKAWPWI